MSAQHFGIFLHRRSPSLTAQRHILTETIKIARLRISATALGRLLHGRAPYSVVLPMDSISRSVYQDWMNDAQQCAEDHEYWSRYFNLVHPGLNVLRELVQTACFAVDIPIPTASKDYREALAHAAIRMLAAEPTRTWADMDRERLRLYISCLLYAPPRRFVSLAQFYRRKLDKGEY